jgi:hypothetical protein
MHSAAIGVVVVVAVALSTIVGGLGRWACSSGDEAPGSLEADLCDGYVGSFGFSWWLAALWPVFAFGASQVVPALRLRPLAVAMSIAVLAAAFWITTALIVVDVG